MNLLLKIYYKVNTRTIFKVAVLTAVTIIFFQIFSQLFVYQYLRIDYYLTFVAVSFLFLGLYLKGNSIEKNAFPKTDDGEFKLLIASLSNKEILILKMIAGGKSNKEIAEENFVEVSTVKTHINNIYSKLKLNNRKEARLKYFEMVEKGLKT